MQIVATTASDVPGGTAGSLSRAWHLHGNDLAATDIDFGLVERATGYVASKTL